MSYFYDNPDVRTDMNNVRRRLAQNNRSGYSCPMTVVFNRTNSVQKDVIPLFYASPVARRMLITIGERDDDTRLTIPGGTTGKAVDILFAYCNGSSHGCNWAADLEERLADTAYVWELARVFRLNLLERFTRAAAFDESTAALNPTTACMLYKNSKEYPLLNRTAFRFIAANLVDVMNADLQQAAEPPVFYFPFLTYYELRDVLCSQHLRATEEQRYEAIYKWHQGNPDRERDRTSDFYRLAGRINYAFIPINRMDILNFRSLQDEIYEIPPCKPETERRKGRRVFFAVRLEPLLEIASEGESTYKPPRLICQFKSHEYYWQLEVPWYGQREVANAPAMGMHLRLLHGTDKAGMHSEDDVVGVEATFILRVHWSANFDKCYRQSDKISVDMMNLPRGDKMFGYRAFLGKRSCASLLRTRRGHFPDAYASVEIVRVRELTQRA